MCLGFTGWIVTAITCVLKREPLNLYYISVMELLSVDCIELGAT